MKASAMDGTPGEDSTSQASDEQLVTLQIYVPELVVQKCMNFNREELIWDVKNQILAALPKELKEGFNYGLFCPPVNGRAGRFLDEERPLMDYPFTESTTYVELRYKRRIYKTAMEEKQLKQLHSRANLRRLLDHVHNSHVEKITKMCSRGLDPNFHCPETGESPLTLATGLKHPAKVIMALVNGGAHLDFRTKDGCTVLHKAVEKNNLEALRTLLDLGSSPNYKDSRGLTTLYYSVLYNSDPQLTEMLLHDHAMIGTADPHGWQEVHQACKYGLVQHLEHLLFYGADMNARNASGNTPLHVCAVNDQESCARVLLFRGADKNALNYANQNPHQVAVIAGNLRLADIIKNHKPEDVVPYRETPRYNPRRRTSAANTGGGGMSQNHSDPRLELASGKPPSPCPSNHSLPHTSSGSDGAIQNSANDEDHHHHHHHHSYQDDTDSSDMHFVGANSSGTDSDPFDSAKSTPLLECVCICVEEYNPSTSGHLQLCKGDLVEVLAVSGSGYLEGRRRDGEEGLFPALCIQEMTVRCADTLPPTARYGRKCLGARSGDMPRKWRMFGEPRTVILHKGKKGFGFILRGAKATSPLMERQPTEFWPSLQYLDDVDKGGVAEMAGLKKGDFLLEINGQDVSQASHEHVVAIIRQSGDLVSMTVVTVMQQQQSLQPTDKSQLLNRQCATLPRKLSTKKAPLPPKRDPKTTLSVGRARARSMVAGLAEIEVLDHTLNEYDSEGRSTKSSSIESIPNKPSAGATPDSTPSTAMANSMTATTTPTSVASTHSSTGGRNRPSSRQVSASELEDFFARHSNNVDHLHCGPIRNKYATIARIHRMKRSKKSSFSHPIRDDTDFRIPKNYSSTPELTQGDTEWNVNMNRLVDTTRKRSRSVGDLNVSHSRHHMRRAHMIGVNHHGHRKDRNLHRQHSIPEAGRTHHGESGKSKERSSTPELQRPTVIKQNGSDIYAETVPVVVRDSEKSVPRASCPPPSYPPPPPPVGQMIKVDVSRGEYANATLGRQHKSTAIMSSFRPTDSAKLYASPDAVTTVGYKRDNLQMCDATLPRQMAKGANLRSHSLPPKMPKNAKAATEAGGRSTGSLDTDYSSGDSTTGYAPTFKPVHRSRDSAATDQAHPPDKRGTLRKVKGAKLSRGPNESSSPKNYTTHEHFIQEPEYDTSEEEETNSALENKSGLVTFKAVDNQVVQNGKIPQQPDSAKEVSNGSSKTRRSEGKTHAQEKSRKLSKEDSLKQDAGREATKTGTPGPGIVQSEETGEKIFLKSEKNRDGMGAAETPTNDGKDGKMQKVPPTPPPKKTEETGTKKAAVELQSDQLADQLKKLSSENVSKSPKESVPFKATIILKQTEVIQKDIKETNKPKSKELTHQHSAHELIQNLEANLKPKTEEEVKTLVQKIKSPPQTLQKPTKTDASPPKESASNDAANSQKVAPAVPKKPRVDDMKILDDSGNESSSQETTRKTVVDANASSTEQQDDVSPSVEMSSRSVKENIYNFEKQSQQASVKANFSPRRKSDVIRMTLVGSQNKNSDQTENSQIMVQTMKTSKSCPKTFEDEDTDISDAAAITAFLASEVESQVTRFSAETPTTTRDFEDWKRPGVVSPVSVPQHLENAIKKTVENSAKTMPMPSGRKPEGRENTLNRRATSSNIDTETAETHFPVSVTTGRQPTPRTVPNVSQLPPTDLAVTLLQAGGAKSTGLFAHTQQVSAAQQQQQQQLRQPVSQTGGHIIVTPTSRPPMSIAVTMIPSSSSHQTSVSHQGPTAHVSTGILSYTVRPPITSIPLVGLSHPPSVPPHSTAYSSANAPHHHHQEHRRHDSEQLVEVSRGKVIPDHSHPHYIESPSQQMKVPMGGQMPPMQSRQLDPRLMRMVHPSGKMHPSETREDDVCLRLCEQVDKSLQLIRLQVDSLGMAAANEPEILTEVVPPPPEFNFAPPQQGRHISHGGHQVHPQHQQPHPASSQGAAVHIAPPPEFSDESLARQRRSHNTQNMMRQAPPQHMMAARPPNTMDAPISRRTVPPEMAGYPYPDHIYKGHIQQMPPDHRSMTLHHPHQQHHHQQQHHLPNNVTSSPVKTMTMTRSGYPSHSLPQHQTRYDTNCSTLPHPGARMVMLPGQQHHQTQQTPMPQQQQQQQMPQQHVQQQQQQHHHPHQRGPSEHPFSPGRSARDDPQMLANIPPPPQPQKEFRQKPLHLWNMKDVSDWLESLFLPEYKITFAEAGINGSKLANMDNNDLMGLGVKQAGHRLNMERSIKWYLK